MNHDDKLMETNNQLEGNQGEKNWFIWQSTIID